MRLVLLSICVFLFLGCSTNSSPNVEGNKPKAVTSPSREPTPSQEEREKKLSTERIERSNAVDAYIAKNHVGWKLEGVSGELVGGCEPGTPCDLHLTRAGQSKVVSVVLKRFQKTDGTAYWLVFDSRTIDLAKARIEAIKDEERAEVLDNLSADDCQNWIDRTIEDRNPDNDYAPGDQDPRG